MKHGMFLKAASVTMFLQLFLVVVVYSQKITVTGKVRDTAFKPLADVTVKIKGEKGEIVTDSTGMYTVTIKEKGVLLFSHTGLISQRIDVDGNTTINVVLKPVEGKDVNTGYGTMKESETPLHSSAVDKKYIDKEKNADMEQLLRTIPGVKVVKTGGDLKVIIRGIKSINGDNFALIVLNGNIYYGSLLDLSRNDIKSIDVLKDAAETAAYGSRGANGVVLITTK